MMREGGEGEGKKRSRKGSRELVDDKGGSYRKRVREGRR